MNWAAKVLNGVVTDVSRVEGAAPDGWIGSDTKIGIGWSYDGATFSPPAAVAGPTQEEVIQQIRNSMIDGSDRDRALMMLQVDIVARAFGLSQQEARAMVLDRLQMHLRNIRGI